MNHISTKFGKRYVDDISVAEVVDYLSFLYYQEGRAYSYVESFLKMFYKSLNTQIFMEICFTLDKNML